MKITVNEKTYNDSTWMFNAERGEAALILKTNESISEVASAFDGNDTIHAFDDNDVETGVWYVKSVISIYQNYESHTPEESRQVVVNIKATALTTEAEEALGSGIDENMEAIMELAGLIADMDDANIRINNIEGILEGIPKNITEQFGNVSDWYNALADRVAALENKMNGEV